MRGAMILVVLVFIVCGLFVVFDLQSSHLPMPRPVLVPTGIQGELPIPEKEFTPILDSAKQEMVKRFSSATMLRNWGRALGWVAIVCSVVVTLVAGFLGKTIKPDSQTSPTIEDVLGQQQNSTKQVRIIGIVLALSTACGLVSNRLESDAKTYASSGVELNKSILKTTETLYDAKTTVVRAKVTIAELQGVMAQQ